MSYTNRIAWEPLRTVDSSTLTGSYQVFGAPLANPCYILKFVNDSDTSITISIDGATDIDVVPAESFSVYDEGKIGDHSSYPAVPQGTQVYLKGGAGTGSVYMVSQYIVQG